MINVQRNPRDCTEFFPKGTTSGKVGPGTYANTFNEPAKSIEENGVPFESLQEKELNANKATSATTPGPGAYIDQGEIAQAGDATFNFKSRVRRIGPVTPGSSIFKESTIFKNPGPGTHNIKTEWQSVTKELPEKSPPVLEMSKTVPSIPPQRIAPGQGDARESDPDMSAIKMRFTGKGEDLPGAGEYSPAGEHVTHALAPSACRWTASSSQRNLFEPSGAIENSLPSRLNPGPGSYNSRRPADPESSKDATFQFASKTPMVHQKTFKKEAADPGPGAYLILDKAKDVTGKENNQFGTTVDRCGWARHSFQQPFTDPYHWGVVGPGHYPESKSCFSGSQKEGAKFDSVVNKPAHAHTKFHGVHHPSQIMALQEVTGPLSAFNTTDVRPCNRKGQQTTPAPGEHNNEESLGFSITSKIKERASVGKKGVFGTTADRFHGGMIVAKQDSVDPTKYDHHEHGKQEEAPRSMFQSAIPRFKPEKGAREVYVVGKKQNPGPTDYVNNKTVNYRSPFRHPRTEHLSFTSGKSRFDDKEIFHGQRYNLNPGPGDYEPLKRSKSLPGAASTRCRRLHDHGNRTMKDVGPGSYNVEGTMLKKTFNVTTEAMSAGSVR
jgi:hypothetical protein